MNLALFDFDGTITTQDSFIAFIRYAVGNVKMMLGGLMMLPILVAYYLKLMSNDQAKQRVISYFFKGMPKQQFRQMAEDYSLRCIDKMIRPKAMAKIRWHQDRGDKVVIVSASIENWLKPWCDQQCLELLATKMEFKNNTVTGAFDGKNCYGEEKVARVKAIYQLDNYASIYAYGDSLGDKQLLDLADIKGFREFE